MHISFAYIALTVDIKGNLIFLRVTSHKCQLDIISKRHVNDCINLLVRNNPANEGPDNGPVRVYSQDELTQVAPAAYQAELTRDGCL